MKRIAAILALAGSLLSCDSPEAIGRFSDQAGKAMAGGEGVSRDVYDSCVRRQSFKLAISPVWEAEPPAPDVRACASLQKAAADAEQATAALEKYFQAMQSLAQYGRIPAGADMPAPVAPAANPIQAVSTLTDLVGHALADGYRRRELAKLLRNADPNIAAVTNMLADIAEKDYLPILREEAAELNDRYFELGRTSGKGNQTLTFLLTRSYHEEAGRIAERRDAAKNFVSAMHDIRDGHHKIAENTNRLASKELAAALLPYTARIAQSVVDVRGRF